MICGVAEKGNIKTTEQNGSRKPYTVWKNIIYRCYDKNNKSYRFYGGIGVQVSSEWLTYENFRSDMESIDGYNKDLFYNGEIELDKDSKNKEAKMYSKETCTWLNPTENKRLIKRIFRPIPTVKILALSPKDELHCVIDIPLFAKSIDVNQVEIYGVISKNGNKTCKGWCFKRVEDFDNISTIRRDDFKQSKFGPTATKYRVENDSEIIIFDHVDEASEFLMCSSSLLTQRTKQLGVYLYKNEYKISRAV